MKPINLVVLAFAGVMLAACGSSTNQPSPPPGSENPSELIDPGSSSSSSSSSGGDTSDNTDSGSSGGSDDSPDSFGGSEGASGSSSGAGGDGADSSGGGEALPDDSDDSLSSSSGGDTAGGSSGGSGGDTAGSSSGGLNGGSSGGQGGGADPDSANSFKAYIYDGGASPLASNSVRLPDAGFSQFQLGGNTPDAHYFSVVGDGTVNFDTSADNAHQYHANFHNVVPSDGVYPKYFTLIAAVTGLSSNRLVEFEVAMADAGTAGSRLKAILRNDGSNNGIQLEQAVDDVSIQQYGLPMLETSVWHIAITMTDAVTGSFRVYRNGGEIQSLRRDAVTMRSVSGLGSNYLRVGDGGVHAYRANIDWVLWSDESAYAPADLAGLLPEGLGCVVGYGSSDHSIGCVGGPASELPDPGDAGENGNGNGNGGGANEPIPDPSPGASGTLSCAKANTVQGFASMNGGTTGGAGGGYLVVKTGADMVNALATKKNNPNPLTIYVNGTITPANSGVNQIDVKDMDNVSVIGVGTAGLFDGIGINIVRANNIVIRNITMREVNIGQMDHISIDDNSKNIWIDHNRFHNKLVVPGCSTENCHKDYYDELVSGKRDVDYITLSYNWMHDSWKTSLWGHSDTDSFPTNYPRKVSFIANRWERVNSRLPLYRFGEAHILNNYYTDVISTGINSRMGAQIRIEGNYFENSKNVIVSYFSSQIGYWDVEDNIFNNVTWSHNPSDGVTAGPNVQSTVSYSPPYSYTAMPASDAKAHVMANAGVNKVSRDCLGVPADIVEGVTGPGAMPGDGGGGELPISGVADGGWTYEAIMMNGGSSITGFVGNSTESEVNFSIHGGKFESSKEGFFLVGKQVDGDFEFTANLKSWNTPTRAGSDQGSVGLLLCFDCENGVSPSAPSVKIGLRDNGLIHTQRLNSGGNLGKTSENNGLVPGDNLYLKITRSGAAFSLSYSVDGGDSYAQVRSGSFSSPPVNIVRVGLYAAHGTTESNSFTFEDIGLTTD